MTNYATDEDDAGNVGTKEGRHYASPPCYLHEIDAAYRDNFDGSDDDVHNAEHRAKFCKKLDT